MTLVLWKALILRVKKNIKFTAAAEINMIIGCGIHERIWRLWRTIPYSFEEVYFKL
jgi:hypothetical protein